MRINIIGPSCAGKSTFASVLARACPWPHFDLDLVMIDHEVLAKTRRLRFRSKAIYSARIQSILCDYPDWIIEGVYAVESVFQAADLIIAIHLPLIVTLRRQWARYFSSELQSGHYGFRNNVNLSISIFSQYWAGANSSDLQDETIFNIRKYDLLLKKYQNKVRKIQYVKDHEMVITRCKELKIL